MLNQKQTQIYHDMHIVYVTVTASDVSIGHNYQCVGFSLPVKTIDPLSDKRLTPSLSLNIV